MFFEGGLEMLNRVILIGRLTRDPELRYTPSGVAVAQFALAVDRPFTNQQGNREADFINIVVWRKQAENCANYLRKGRLVAVEGRIQTRNYENSEGRRVYVTEVVANNVRFLESAGSAANREETPNRGMYDNNNANSNSNNTDYNNDIDPFSDDGKPVDISDDDLPF